VGAKIAPFLEARAVAQELSAFALTAGPGLLVKSKVAADEVGDFEEFHGLGDEAVHADLEAATAWVEAHGGRRRGDDADREEHGWRWRRMADPDGNEFCLVPEASG